MAQPHAMFWSGETLKEHSTSLVKPFDSERVDCAAYTLSVGCEVYVSPSDQTADPTAVTVRKLAQGEAFNIPPGQFAFLITEEVVTVPSDALAFISIRAKIKFHGLVNVSGFHVDPGYEGQLTFAVFNAGPLPVHLKQGQPIFLIWYASLDRKSTSRKYGSVKRGLDTELINAIPGKLQSFASLSNRIQKVERALDNFKFLASMAIMLGVAIIAGLAVAKLSPISQSVQGNGLPKPPAASSVKQSEEFGPGQDPEAIGKTAPLATDGDTSLPKRHQK